MKSVQYRIKINGLKSPEGTIPMIALKEISESLLQGSERALRLSIEGVSAKRGKVPKWLKESLEFTLTGISKGSTMLEIDAPTLQEVAPDKVKQLNLWYKVPEPKDTALSLLGRSVLDATTGQLESERYDRGVLDAILSFRPFLREYASEFEVNCPNRPKENFKINIPELDKIVHIEAEIPEPQAIALAGSFNLIEHTSRRFELILDDNKKISGRIVSSYVDVEQMRRLWGRKVTLKGTAYFKPSGCVRLVEAEMIKPFEHGEEVFQSIPEPKMPIELISKLKKKYGRKSPLMEVWGKWPGEESIDEILGALKKTSVENV